MSSLQGAYEQIDKRLGSVEGQIRDLRTEVHALRTEIRGRFQWLVSLLIFAIFAPIVLRLMGY